MNAAIRELRFQAALAPKIFVEHRLYAIALLRIGLSATILSLYLQHWRQREFIWGPHGVIPQPLFEAFSRITHTVTLYQFSGSSAYSDVLFAAGAIVAAANLLGIWSRVTSVAFYVFTWSIYQRNFLVLDGGDNLLYLLAFFLMFTDSGRRLSLDALLRKKDAPVGYFTALLHNAGVVAIIAQVLVLYAMSAFYKSQGVPWQNGTAIYYVLNNAEFNMVPWMGDLVKHGVVTTSLTYMTLAFQAAFPFLIFHKRIKWVMIAGAIAFHSGIAVFMGLAFFSAVMICSEFVFLSDRDYAVAFAIMSRFARRVIPSRFAALTAREASPSV